MRKLFLLFSLVMLVIGSFVPATAQDEELPTGTIADVIEGFANLPIPEVEEGAEAEGEAPAAPVGGPQFTVLNQALDVAGLKSTLRDTGNTYTLLAPTDAAFARLDRNELDKLLQDPAAMSNRLLYHVLPGLVTSGVVPTRLFFQTVQGEDIAVTYYNDFPFINGETAFVRLDIPADNGVIHVIDTVLIPPYATGGNDVWLATRDQFYLDGPNGLPRRPRRVLRRCKTINVVEYRQGFVLAEGLGEGWLSTQWLQNVAENFNQPDGPQLPDNCQQ